MGKSQELRLALEWAEQNGDTKWGRKGELFPGWGLETLSHGLCGRLCLLRKCLGPNHQSCAGQVKLLAAAGGWQRERLWAGAAAWGGTG